MNQLEIRKLETGTGNWKSTGKHVVVGRIDGKAGQVISSP